MGRKQLRYRRVALLLSGLLAWSCSKSKDPTPPTTEPAPATAATGPQKSTRDVVFVVLDNVRADHMSLCGYERPTTPGLEQLRRRGASVSCRAYAPGDWTLPSHASYFTGLPVPTHGAHGSMKAPAMFSWGGHAFPLDNRAPTLAETLGERGYDTVMVSGNPVVSKATGLDRGFAVTRSARQFGPWYGKPLVDQVAAALDARTAHDRPLFLFVNIADAHSPWSDVPEGVPWLPPRRGMRYRIEKGSVFVRYANGELSEEEVAKLLPRYRDVYDFGIGRADSTLTALLDLLGERGLLEPHDRLVVTSDHGEMLGEHGAVGHCCAAYEGEMRVPVIYRGPTPVELPTPMSALDTYHLVLDGRLPEEPTQIRAMAGPGRTWLNNSKVFGQSIWAATWNANDKLVWRDGKLYGIDLEADPGEDSPTPVAEDDDRIPALKAFAAEVARSYSRDPERNDELDAQLKALGYVE